VGFESPFGAMALPKGAGHNRCSLFLRHGPSALSYSPRYQIPSDDLNHRNSGPKPDKRDSLFGQKPIPNAGGRIIVAGIARDDISTGGDAMSWSRYTGPHEEGEELCH